MASGTTTKPQGGGRTATAALQNKTPAPGASLSLADLTPEDRDALVREAATIAVKQLQAAQAEADAAKPDPDAAAHAAATRRSAAIAALLDDRDHLKGCPATGRVEAYAATKPANPAAAIPEKPVTVVRCIECGGSTVLEQSYDITAAQLVAATDD